MKSINQKGFSLLDTLLALVLVSAIGATGYFAITNLRSNGPNATKADTKIAPKIAPSPTQDPYAGWSSYKLKKEGFTIRYPATWVFKEESKAEYMFENYSLASKTGYKISIQVGAFASDGGVGTDTKIETVAEINTANSAKPLKLVIYYDPATNGCCPPLVMNDHGNVHPFFQSKIKDRVPSYNATNYEDQSLSNYVSIRASYDSAPEANIPKTRTAFLSSEDYTTALKILGSVKYE